MVRRLLRTLVFFSLAFSATAAFGGGLVDSLPPRLPWDRCPAPAQLTLDQAAQAVRALYLPYRQLVTSEVSGVRLTDDARAIHALFTMLGKKPPAAWAGAAHCHDTVCALRAALGDEPYAWEGALWLLVIAAEGPVASLDQAPWDQPSRWHVSELRTVAHALHDVRAELGHARDLRVLRRIPDGETVPTAMADGHLGNLLAASLKRDARLGVGATMLRDALFAQVPEVQRVTIAHEIAHQIEFTEEENPFGPHETSPESHSDRWLAIGGWTPPLFRSLPVGYQRHRGADEEPWTDQAWPSEEFPDAVAHFRYAGELLHAYSPAAYKFVAGFFDREYRQPSADPPLDAFIAQAGGVLALFRRCDKQVELTWQGEHGGAAWLTRSCPMPSGATAPIAEPRWAFVAGARCQSCVDMALDKLRKQKGFANFSCTRDPDELNVALAQRLEEVEGAFYEAAAQVTTARPAGTFERCAKANDLTGKCLGGPAAWRLARGAAERLFARFSQVASIAALAPGELDRLTYEILRQTALGLHPTATAQRFPILTDGKQLLATCLDGVSRIGPRSADDAEQRFWMTGPQHEGGVRGYLLPPLAEPCAHLYSADLAARHLQLDPGNEPYFFRLAVIAAAPLARTLRARLFGAPWDALHASCGLTPAPPTAQQLPCVTTFMAAQLDGLVPEPGRRALARKLAAAISGP